MDDVRPPRGPRQRGRTPMPSVDIADKIVAFQRRNAAATKPRDRADRSPAKRRAPSPPPITVEPAPDPNPDDFDRRLRIAPDAHHPTPSVRREPPAPPPPHRTLEPEPISTAHRPKHPPQPANPQQTRQLFDPHKHDPVRFQAGARTPRPAPASKSSGDTFVSASSTSASSYAHSIGSAFTLTSNSTGTSGSSLSGFNPPKDGADGNNAFVFQLKRLYRDITALEGKLIADELDLAQQDEPRITLQGKATPDKSPDDKYLKVINDHKRLADMMQQLMTMTLSPQVPTSVHSISTKYNIPTRLWGNAFHRVLEALRRASASSPIALEHLNDMIFWAYSFYTALVEDPQVETFKASWLEALGDLARYRMAIATFNPSSDFFGPSAQLHLPTDGDEGRPDESPHPSVGVHAAQALDVEPENEQWRGTARRWYAQGLQDTPGTGKLHHHLGLLSREARDEDLRAIYHFMKSLTVTHPFLTTRETILSLFSLEAQRRRALPEASTKELFILLQGMLFTHIELDEFPLVLARFLERLSLDDSSEAEAGRLTRRLEEREWIMMGVLNIAAMLEYGKPNGVLKAAGAGDDSFKHDKDRKHDVKSLVKRSEGLQMKDDAEISQPMELDSNENFTHLVFATGEVATSNQEMEQEIPLTFNLSLQLAFGILKHVLLHPLRKPTPFARSSLNPYIDMILTFLASTFKNHRHFELMQRHVPWTELVAFLNTAPHSLQAAEAESGARITQGCLPLPEDWCLRGMEWVARRTYERGFWKTDAGLGGEQAVLSLQELGADATDGIIEDDDDDDDLEHKKRDKGETHKRWVRILRAASIITRSVGDFSWDATVKQWRLTGQLERKVAEWRQEDLRAEDGLGQSRHHSRRVSATEGMEIDDSEHLNDESSSGDSEGEFSGDSEEVENVRELMAKRRRLRALLKASNLPRRERGKPNRRSQKPGYSIRMVPGYTALVIDTNILLSSLQEFITLVDGGRWTIIVPLAVVTELDGLSSNQTELGQCAASAIKFLSSHIRTHTTSLKVQTSKGNYLATLNIRSEDVHFMDGEASWDRNMDDLILRAAIWQELHWVDRSNLLKPSPDAIVDETASKVALLTLDRNLRLKARARAVAVAGPKELADILVGTH